MKTPYIIGIALGILVVLSAYAIDYATRDPIHDTHVYEAGQHKGQLVLCHDPRSETCDAVIHGWTWLVLDFKSDLKRCDVPADGCGQAGVPR